ncbi:MULTISPECIES: alpha-hydroxy acid oxidase [unclassified Caballeronia]|uniref:alpha-hydroxy acid oxidase n=2 Tax=Caballeronia TaxID=1827195 RepID=UPI00285E4D68|nr:MULTISPECIES: alpha-hydroxy acid oxidase [unclassified Caballeronia]MDR5773851.1 alpha-hydroxy acid oxidase [Caballeronia sp. LZ002]MDR5849286.1 alpha-hydroxy acid oxidase [Caballeronia sp. LZ003]
MMRHYATIEELRIAARKRVPRMFYDYVDAGSWTESTYRANSDDFAQLQFRQRVAVDFSERNLTTTMAGIPVSMPVAIAPTGIAGMQRADGEILAARAAARFGVPFTLSTVSICSIEDVAAHTQKPFWFQLYMMKDRGFIADLIYRAKIAGCSALVLTLDLQIQGQRHKDKRNGLSAPPKLTLRNLAHLSRYPRWCAGMLGTPRRTFGNIVGHAPGVTGIASMADWAARQFDPTLTWQDIDWVRKQWGGKIILKGILDEEDARIARDIGADALIVSNHGGRQLDGAPSSISMLPRIAEAVHGDIELHMDGGIRSGQDVLKALACGARGVYIGRAFLYGLGAEGEAGVTRALEIIRDELDMTMALAGVTDTRAIDGRVLRSGGFTSGRGALETPVRMQVA